MIYSLDTVFFSKTQRMDDQNPQTQQGGGTNPAATDPNATDSALPWMNFSPDTSSPQSGVASDDTTSGAQPAGGALPVGDSFDPFGNPFAANESPEDAAAAFAPKAEDGSFTPPTDNTFTGTFVPSEPSAFTPTLESVTPTTQDTLTQPPEEQVAPVQEVAPSPEVAEVQTPEVTEVAEEVEPSGTPDWMNGGSTEKEDAGEYTDIDNQNTMPDTNVDSLTMLASLKERFEEEEDNFNQEVEDHNLNIQYEKNAIAKLREARSDRLMKMREIVQGFGDVLGIRRGSENQSSENKSRDNNHKPARRHESEPRKVERTQPKKKETQKPVDDFLAA